MSFYENLRDDTAGPLIAEFGMTGVYRSFGAEVYDNVTGTTLKGSSTDLAIVLLDLPLKEREFSEEVTARADASLLVGATPFALAGTAPKVNEEVLVGSKTYRILAINTVGPAGVAVIYKMAVQNV